ncbi:MAG: Hsp33 family molecular chaperone HslO, partial [Pseudomonadota bacterium]
STVEAAELIDPDLPMDRLLYRLFNEDGVRVLDRQMIRTDCKCAPDRLENTIKSFDAETRVEMADEDGMIRARCEFCEKEFVFDVSKLDAA